MRVWKKYLKIVDWSWVGRNYVYLYCVKNNKLYLDVMVKKAQTLMCSRRDRWMQGKIDWNMNTPKNDCMF